MSKKPTVLMILDGYGLNDKCEHNAVCEAKTPIMDQLMSQCPYVKGQASGLAVGLPDGQMGNSEVGHLNMGAGRVVYQELTRITKAIQDGDFFENEELVKAVENAKANNSALHLFGLLSDGGVHSHITHVFGLLELAKRKGLEKVYVHCFLDGRDTSSASRTSWIFEGSPASILLPINFDHKIPAKISDRIPTGTPTAIITPRSTFSIFATRTEPADGGIKAKPVASPARRGIT